MPNGNRQEKPLEEFIIIFNFFRNLRPLVEDWRPDKFFFCLEGHPQFRYDLFPTYKSNRLVKHASQQESKEKITHSAEEIIRLLQYFPITIARALHYEADDLIGSLAENMNEEDLTVITADKDYIQLLQRGYKNLIVYNPIKKEAMKAPPWPEIAHKSIVGDKSDGLPRLASDKKAEAMMKDPELFRQFMSNQEKATQFRINKALIEFCTVPAEEIILLEGIRNFEALRAEFARMDFQSIINERSWEKYTKTFDCIRY